MQGKEVNKPPHWILSARIVEEGNLNTELTEKLLSEAVLWRVTISPSDPKTRDLWVVVKSFTHPMCLYPEALWRDPLGEVFEDKTAGPHLVTADGVRAVEGVAKEWCQDTHGSTIEAVSEFVLDRMRSIVIAKAWSMRKHDWLNASALNTIAAAAERILLSVDPFATTADQLVQIADTAAGKVGPVSPPVPLSFPDGKPSCTCIYGVRIPMPLEERKLWQDFDTALEMLSPLGGDKAEDFILLAGKFRFLTLGSPLPLARVGFGLDTINEDLAQSIELQMNLLKQQFIKVAALGPDEEYLALELVNIATRIIELRGFRYTEKWDVLRMLPRIKQLPIGPQPVSILGAWWLGAVSDAINTKHAECRLETRVTSSTCMELSRRHLWHVVLDESSVLSEKLGLIQPRQSPMIWILYDFEWDNLVREQAVQLEIIQWLTYRWDAYPHSACASPLVSVLPASTSSAPHNGTSTKRVVLGNGTVLEHSGSEERVWVCYRQGQVQDCSVNNLSIGNTVVLKDNKKISAYRHAITKALTPESVQKMQEELSVRLKILGLSQVALWRKLVAAGCEVSCESEISQWKTGRTWGPKRPEDLEKLAQVLESEWLLENWRTVAQELRNLRTETRYRRTFSDLLRKAAQHRPRWTHEEKSLLDRAGLALEDLRNCFDYTSVVRIEPITSVSKAS